MLKEFTYVKDNEDASERKLLVFSCPSNMYFGLDVSAEYSEAEIKDFAHRLAELKHKHKEESNALVAKLGLTSRYRTFKKDNVYD